MSDSLLYGLSLGGGLLVLTVAAAYVRIAVVLAVLRSALGFGALPRSVTALLALVLALFVMMPVVEQGASLVGAMEVRDSAAPRTDGMLTAMTLFLDKHTPAAERRTFVELAKRLRPPEARDHVASVGDKDPTVLAPAFLVAELKAAFEIGFLLFLPFLVLELVVASLLTTLGMHALDPRAVSLPFKLLLFVAADGWHLLARGLVLGYT